MKYILLSILFLSITFSVSAQFSITGVGASHTERQNGVNIICVDNLSSLSSAEYRTSASSVRFFEYSETSSPVEIPATEISRNGDVYILSNLKDEHGYVVSEDGGDFGNTMWIIDYSRHLPEINSVVVGDNTDENQECQDRKEILSINEVGGNRLLYCLSNLEKRYLSRTYKIRYEDYNWGDEEFDTEVREEYATAEGNEIKVGSPLKDTEFIIIGDKIAETLGLVIDERMTEMFSAVRVDPHVIIHRENQEEDNTESEDGQNESSDGDSAPLTITFEGVSNEPATLYYTWFMKKDTEDDWTQMAFMEKDFTYTFLEEGDYRVKLEVASANNVCVRGTEEHSVKIAESELKVPNYFLPGNTAEGDIPNEFKVKHKSLVKFKCTIFNRWGQKVYQFDDPDQGWDGRYKGKLVNPGVYFYVIEATGSEGKKYKEGGDINILHSK